MDIINQPKGLSRQKSSSDDVTSQIQPIGQETFFLLHEGDQERKEDYPGGWTLESPFWALSSSILLTVTYRAAWQSIPEFTKRTVCGCIQNAIGSICCCCSLKIPAEVYSLTYTSRDVAKAERKTICIRGMGACIAVQLHLKPRDLLDDDAQKVPLELQPAWQGYLDRMAEATARKESQQFVCSKNQDEEQLPPPPWHDMNTTNEFATSRYGPVLTFCIPRETVGPYDPPLLWKVQFPPNPNVEVDTWTVLDGELHNAAPSHVFVQGYQSWSYCGSLVKGRDQPSSALPGLISRAFNLGGAPPPVATAVLQRDDGEDSDAFPRKPSSLLRKKVYSSDFFTCITSEDTRTTEQTPDDYESRLDEAGGPALILGWLAQHEQLGVVKIQSDLQHFEMHATHNAILHETSLNETDWAYAQLVSPHSYDEEPMVHFLHAVAAYHQARPLQNGPLLTGWCSWYHYYENISAGTLRENFSKLHSLRNTVPTNVAVIDDGYMTAWGDWDSLKPGKFPDEGGLKVVANDIRAYGMRPGIWLAPFACDKHSNVAKRHPDWIIRNDRGVPANSGNCGKFFYGLDATNPHVREHVYTAVRRAVRDWGFEVLKIDFLYAACLEGNGKYDLGMTRAQAMHLALQTIRSAAGSDAFLIGCGCPIGSGVGYVDGMRISADTGPTWYPAKPLPWWDNGTIPCLRSMIRNSLSRAPMGHRWWHNDPDCLLLGETTSLTDLEVASAATIVAMTCGMMLLSDDLTKVSFPRLNILGKIFPMTGATAIVLDLHGTDDGLPRLLRLWCTDKYDFAEKYYRDFSSTLSEVDKRDHNAEATFFGRLTSFAPDEPAPHPNERRRNCIHVVKGLGTWTLLSLSNWQDKAAIVRAPAVALPPPASGWGTNEPEALGCSGDGMNGKHLFCHGYHVFAFWSAKYSWLPNETDEASTDRADTSLTRWLGPHETEIFHIRPVTPKLPQYIGSDLHYSCGHEVRRFEATANLVKLSLRTEYNRRGYVFLFVPTANSNNIEVVVRGEPGMWNVVGNTPAVSSSSPTSCLGRVIRIMVVIHGDGSKRDGQVLVKF